jgi:hypothetical protein
MRDSFKIVPVLGLLLLLTACSKGHRVRVSNYYYETLDSVIVGRPEHIFTDIKHGVTTSYQGISSGEHGVRCITADGATFSGTASLTKDDQGDFTIQIDGLKSIVVLKD